MRGNAVKRWQIDSIESFVKWCWPESLLVSFQSRASGHALSLPSAALSSRHEHCGAHTPWLAEG